MKLEIHDTGTALLCHLKSGDAFILLDPGYDGRVFIRTGIRTDDRFTCFDLEDASMVMFMYDLKVRPLKLKVVPQ